MVNCSYEVSKKKPNRDKHFYSRWRPDASLAVLQHCYHSYTRNFITGTAEKGDEEYGLWIKGMDCVVLWLVEVDSWLWIFGFEYVKYCALPLWHSIPRLALGICFFTGAAVWLLKQYLNCSNACLKGKTDKNGLMWHSFSRKTSWFHSFQKPHFYWPF